MVALAIRANKVVGTSVALLEWLALTLALGTLRTAVPLLATLAVAALVTPRLAVAGMTVLAWRPTAAGRAVTAARAVRVRRFHLRRV